MDVAKSSRLIRRLGTGMKRGYASILPPTALPVGHKASGD